MIHHCVFFSFRPECGQDQRTEILSGLEALIGEVPGMVSFAAGANADFESKSQQYTDGFIAVFEDQDALAAYATNPRHVELGGQLAESCVNGHSGIIVFDLVESDEA